MLRRYFRSPFNEIRLTSLDNANYRVLSALNAKLLSNSTSMEQITARLHLRGEQYYPNIYVPNKEKADYSLTPIIAVSKEFDYKHGEQVYENMIVAWTKDEQGNVQNILLDEQTAYSVPNPVLIVNHAPYSVIPKELQGHYKGLDSEVNAQQRALGYGKVELYSFSASSTYRHESSGDSEYYLGFRGCQSGSGYPTENTCNHNTYELEWSGDFDRTIYTLEDHTHPTTYYGSWVISYEYDWSASVKYVLVDDSDAPVEQLVAGRMGSSSDWWQKMFLKNGIDERKSQRGHLELEYYPWKKSY